MKRIDYRRRKTFNDDMIKEKYWAIFHRLANTKSIDIPRIITEISLRETCPK